VTLDLPGPTGRLEALLEEPAGARHALVVCHPHPLHGGTMNTHAVYRIARAARSLGFATLRFNFRGVGRSHGTWDEGRGEAEDARAALAWLAAERPALRRYASGFSFGAWMALEAGCGDPSVPGVLCAGLTPRMFTLQLARSCPKPVAVIQAENDAYGSPEDIGRLLEGAEAPRRLAPVPGATHLFTEDLPGLEREAGAALGWLLERS
jgi:alpha/beta superfamily hydrolase